MLKFKVSVDYLRLFKKLQKYEDEELMNAYEKVFKDYLSRSIQRRLASRVKKVSKTGETYKAVQAGEWVIKRQGNKFITKFIIDSDYFSKLEEGGKVVGKGMIAIPKPEQVLPSGQYPKRFKEALIPGTAEFKKSFIRKYGSYSIMFMRGERPKTPTDPRDGAAGIWILKKMVSLEPHNFFRDAISAAENDMANKMAEILEANWKD